jgi:subtilisin-like proprotein convertase family protein
VFDYSLTPELDIPDNDATGVRVDFDVEKEGIAASVEVTVQIEHPYRGDLAVSLVAPSGNIVGLHHQQGGNQQDLYRTFDVVNTPSLGDLAGEAIHGQWTLRVQDLAPKDEGVFKECGLRIQTLQSSVIELAESPGTRIPDAVPAGIERTLSTDASGTVREVEVSVDITHTYIRDLVIELVSPKGTVIELHRRAGGDADNVIETYKVASVFELDTLRGENVAGSWRLMLKDLEAKDEGKLNHWGLKIITED